MSTEAAIPTRGRVARLISWLIQHSARVERVKRGRLTVDLGPDSFTPEVTEVYPRESSASEDQE